MPPGEVRASVTPPGEVEGLQLSMMLKSLTVIMPDGAWNER